MNIALKAFPRSVKYINLRAVSTNVASVVYFTKNVAFVLHITENVARNVVRFNPDHKNGPPAIERNLLL
jgi:hypothetical protein